MAGTLARAGTVWQTPVNPPEAQNYIFRNVKCGRLQVDEPKVHADYIVKSSEKISHFLHRIENIGNASEDLIRKVEKSLKTVTIWGKRRKRGITKKPSTDTWS